MFVRSSLAGLGPRLGSGRSAVSAAAALSLTLCAHAQDAAPQVVVTAARLEQPLAQTLPHTTVLTRDDIERSQAVELECLLTQ